MVDTLSVDKALGLDGYNVRIFQILWDTMKRDVMDGLTHLCLGRRTVQELNHTFIM